METPVSQWRRQRRTLLYWLFFSALGSVTVVTAMTLMVRAGRLSRERADFTITICVVTLAVGALMAVARHWKCPVCEGTPTPWKTLFLSALLPAPVRCGSCRSTLQAE